MISAYLDRFEDDLAVLLLIFVAGAILNEPQDED